MIIRVVGALCGALAFACLASVVFRLVEARWPRSPATPLEPRLFAICLLLFALNSTAGILLLDRMNGGAAGGWPAGVIAFVLADLLRYWLHRAMHRWRPLWYFHRLHHRSDALRWWHTWALHPVDYLLHAAAGLLPFWLLGSSPEVWIGAAVVRKLWSHLLHANVLWPPSWIDRVLVTPRAHHAHHERAQVVTNFATLFSIWDRWWGTASAPLQKSHCEPHSGGATALP